MYICVAVYIMYRVLCVMCVVIILQCSLHVRCVLDYDGLMVELNRVTKGEFDFKIDGVVRCVDVDLYVWWCTRV